MLKKLLHFSRELVKPENPKFHISCLLRENFSNISVKSFFYTFLYKEAKFSKLKYFLINIIKCFFSFLNIFSIPNQFIFFHLLRNFCNAHDQILLSFFYYFRQILISFTSFVFVIFPYFLGNI